MNLTKITNRSHQWQNTRVQEAFLSLNNNGNNYNLFWLKARAFNSDTENGSNLSVDSKLLLSMYTVSPGSIPKATTFCNERMGERVRGNESG